MAYQVLARKWRPRNFAAMAGQSHVLQTLVNSLDQNRLHHAYLFTGTRGVGKTTIARILAKCLNCEQGVSSRPCGECGACREIDEGRFIDLIEVDAASRTKVEDTRELLENVQYSPTRGRYKVYLIDEVHMLSGHSFNALLKTLEEPPPHVKFLLATTDPQKLPVTVLSRCLQFNLKNLSPEQLVTHLRYILEQEAVPFEEAALWQLGRAAQGSVRDSLTLLDQAISFCEGHLRDDAVRTLLGTIDQGVIHALVDALAAGDARALLEAVAQAAEHAPDFGAVLEELLGYLHRVAIAQVVPDGIDNSQGDQERVLAHAGGLAAENVQLYYQIALKGREELPLAVDPRSGLEMTLLRMLAFTPDGVPQSPTVPLGPAEAAPAPSAAVAAGADPGLKKKPLRRPEPKLSAPEPPPAPAVNGERPAGQVETPPCPSPAPGAPAEAAAGLENAARRPQITLEALDAAGWIALFRDLDVSGITRNIAANCALQAADSDGLSLVLAESQASVFNEEHKRRIQTALSEYFGRPLALRMEFGTPSGETPAAWRKRKESERQRLAVEAFEQDANVQEIVKRFSGTIQTDSIVPLTPKQY